MFQRLIYSQTTSHILFMSVFHHEVTNFSQCYDYVLGVQSVCSLSSHLVVYVYEQQAASVLCLLSFLFLLSFLIPAP